jgi:hypothetical protein
MNTQDNPELKGAAKLVRYLRRLKDSHYTDLLDTAVDVIKGEYTAAAVTEAQCLQKYMPDTYEQYPFLGILAGAADTTPETLKAVAEEALACLIHDAVEEGES